MINLAPELLQHCIYTFVFQNLDIADLGEVPKVCRLWRVIADQELIWKRIRTEYCPHAPSLEDCSSKELVRRYIEGKSIRHIQLIGGHIHSAWGDRLVYWKNQGAYSARGWECHQTLSTHQGMITCFRVRTIGMVKFMITGSTDRTLKIWTQMGDSFEETKTLTGHSDTITALEALDTRIYSGSRDHKILVWKYDTHIRNISLESVLEGHTGAITALTINKQCERFLYSGSTDNTVRVWAIDRCIQIITIPHGRITCLEYSSFHDALFSGSKDGTLSIWKNRDNNLEHEETKISRYGGILSILKSELSPGIYSLHDRGFMQLWDKKRLGPEWEERIDRYIGNNHPSDFTYGVENPFNFQKELFVTCQDKIIIFRVMKVNDIPIEEARAIEVPSSKLEPDEP